MFANLSSFVWGRLSTGRSKVSVACVLQALIIACVVSVALIFDGAFGAAVLVSSMIASRVLLAGVVTVRSVIWSLNFARNQRARATSQLQMINAVVTVIISSAIGPLLDTYPDSLAWIYGLAPYLGGLGLRCLRKYGWLARLVSSTRASAATQSHDHGICPDTENRPMVSLVSD